MQDYAAIAGDLWNVQDGVHLVQVPEDRYREVLAMAKRGAGAYLMPQEVADVLNGHFQNKIRLSRGFNPLAKMLEGFDRVQKTWVNYTLFPVPVYHFRNAFSDGILAMQKGHYDLPEYSPLVSQMQQGRKLTIRDPFGRTYTTQEFMKQLEDGGLDASGWSVVALNEDIRDLMSAKTSVRAALGGAAIGAAATGTPGGAALGFLAGSTLDLHALKGAEGFRDWAKRLLKLRPYLNDRNFLISYTKKVARAGEANRRMSLALKLVMTEGLTPFEAAREANKVFLDFRNLSQTEQHFFRRVFPFYSWSRHDLPRQVEMLATRPHTMAAVAKVRRLAEQSVIPEAVRPSEDFYDRNFADSLPIPLYEIKPGVYQEWYLKSWIPQGELLNMVDPVGAALGMLTPLAKTLIESGTPLPDVINDKLGGFRGFNKNLYFNQPLDGTTTFEGIEMSKRDANLYRNVRLLGMWDKMAHNQHLPWYRAAVEHFVGRPYTADLMRMRQSRLYDLDRHIADQKIKVSRATRDLTRMRARGQEGKLQMRYLLSLEAELARAQAERDIAAGTPVTTEEAARAPKRVRPPERP